MSARSARTEGEAHELSPECTLASRPGYGDARVSCRRLRDIPLPRSGGLPLIRRCGCMCHNPSAERTRVSVGTSSEWVPGGRR